MRTVRDLKRTEDGMDKIAERLEAAGLHTQAGKIDKAAELLEEVREALASL
jgi:hypothetical protein